jgi:hypothetical protein
MNDLEQRFGVAGGFAECFRDSDNGVDALSLLHKKCLFIASCALIFFSVSPIFYKLFFYTIDFSWTLAALYFFALFFSLFCTLFQSYSVRILKKADAADYHAFDVEAPNLDITAKDWHDAVLLSGRSVYCFDLEIMSMLDQAAAVSKKGFFLEKNGKKISATV